MSASRSKYRLLEIFNINVITTNTNNKVRPIIAFPTLLV